MTLLGTQGLHRMACKGILQSNLLSTTIQYGSNYKSVPYKSTVIIMVLRGKKVHL